MTYQVQYRIRSIVLDIARCVTDFKGDLASLNMIIKLQTLFR